MAILRSHLPLKGLLDEPLNKQELPFVVLLHHILYGIQTLYLFTCSNHIDIVLVCMIFGALNAYAAPILNLGPSVSILQPAPSLPLSISHTLFGFLASTPLPSMLLWTYIHLLLLCLQNQHHASSIAEDQLNKPWRPLPSGRLSRSQAEILLLATYPAALLASWFITSGFWPSVGVVLFGVLYNECGGAADPWAKNVLNATGIVCLLAGPLEVATGRAAFGGVGGAILDGFISGMRGGEDTGSAGDTIVSADTAVAVKWFAVIGGAILCTVQAQDFRDRDGDAKAGRRTLPLVMGDAMTRAGTALGVGFWTWAAGAFWGSGWMEMVLPIASGAWFVISLLKDRSVRADATTWKIWPLWFASLFLLPVFKMRDYGGA